MDSYKITIEGRQFKKCYLVYVIRITNSEHGDYYYIGQTGDGHHLTARPPFRRLAGHLDDQKSSTQNQIYKGIIEKILGLEVSPNKPYNDKTKNQVSDFLVRSTIEMEAFNLIDFEHGIDKEDHRDNVRLVKDIEKSLIQLTANKVGLERVINKSFPQPSSDEKNIYTAEKIFKKVFEGS